MALLSRSGALYLSFLSLLPGCTSLNAYRDESVLLHGRFTTIENFAPGRDLALVESKRAEEEVDADTSDDTKLASLTTGQKPRNRGAEANEPNPRAGKRREGLPLN